MKRYYVRDDKKLFGPIEKSRLVSAYDRGFFSVNAEVSCDKSEWISLIYFINSDQKQVIPTSNRKENSVFGRFISSFLLLLFLAAGVAGAYWWFYLRSDRELAPEQEFKNIADKYHCAVGLLTVELVARNGDSLAGVSGLDTDSELTLDIAFAVAPDVYVSTWSRLDSLKNISAEMSNNIVFEAVNSAYVKSRSSYSDFREFCSVNADGVKKLRNAVNNGLKIKRIYIKHHGTANASVVKSVRIHPSANSQNPRCDIAMYRISGRRDIFFKQADPATVAHIMPGALIGCVGMKKNSDGLPVFFAKCGKIMESTVETGRNITCDIPAAGNISGAPLLLLDGRVIGMITDSNLLDSSISTMSATAFSDVEKAQPVSVNTLLK
ncbi:MAG: hypothetical protein IJC21_01715 [Lentisphaeria bacterium]|nr:hypothetical protein [Lentisphaeria bacterium]